MKSKAVDLRLSSGADPQSPFVRFGGDVLLLTPPRTTGRGGGARNGRTLREGVSPQHLYLVAQVGNRFEVENPEIPVLYRKGRYLVVEVSPRRAALRKHPSCYTVKPFRAGETIFETVTPAASRAGRDPRIVELLQQLSPDRMRQRLEFLAAIHTRLSTSADYRRAAEWAATQFREHGYSADLVQIQVGGGRSFNVVAEASANGSDRPVVIVTAHLDSVNSDGGSSAPAPGADDNASGSAGALELAAALQTVQLGVDPRFILFGGEEQGLFGSRAYVRSLSAAERARIVAVVNMDMIGTVNATPERTVLLEGAPLSRPLLERLSRAASTYTDLAVQTSLHPFNSDHVPFINEGVPAVLLIEGTDSANTSVHTAGDTIDRIDYSLMSQILATHAAFIGELAGIQERTRVMRPTTSAPQQWTVQQTREIIEALRRESSQFSGVYTFNDGASRTATVEQPDRSTVSAATMNNPIYRLDEPVFLEAPAASRAEAPVRFTLRVDIDGDTPLKVVSGTLESTGGLESEVPQHFIGRVSTNVATASGRGLVVGEFRCRWPDTGDPIDSLEVELAGTPLTAPIAAVTFVDTAHARRFGPFNAQRSSAFFHDVEIDVDREVNAVEFEPLNTHIHPDRPPDLPLEELTLESAFGVAGIRITRTQDSPAAIPAPPGHTWDFSELHDSMVEHWEAFANRPQWKMWVLLADRADDDGLGGVMFDGDIDEPGGVDRQGTALFTRCPFFHTAAGGYVQANPPHDEAIKRELFFNLIHETGHAFNLAHSFQKHLGRGWTPPAWSPLQSNAQAMSWMNYPDQAQASLAPNASWFYKRFRFRFDRDELLFLRHAPESFVQMGATAWFDQHGRVYRDSVDERLRLSIRTRKTMLQLGEPVLLELKLERRDGAGGPVTVHSNLDPSDGLVDIAITNPRGERRPFLPIDHTRSMLRVTTLETSAPAVYGLADVTMGAFGFHFKEPGAYRIEASYTNVDGRTAAAVLQLYVEPPASYAAVPVVNEMFDARLGRALYVEGTRAQGEINSKMEWITRELARTIGENNPIATHLKAVRWKPLAREGCYIDGTNSPVVTPQRPDEVVKALEPVLVDKCEAAADTMGHIWYREMMDTYTTAAEEAHKPQKAAEAQRTMYELFSARKVVEPVLRSIERRAARYV